MSMVCPQCQGSFPQRLECPACGVRLEYQANSRAQRGATPEGHAWQQTPWGRIFVGLLLAQGLYYGLWHLCRAGLLAVSTEAEPTWWTTLSGLLVVQGLQAVSLLAGGTMAGASKRQGIVYGGLVGLANGLIFVCVQQRYANLFTPVVLYGQPILQTALGAAGGIIGRVIWRPLTNPARAGTLLSGPVAAVRGKNPSPFAGPIAWWRVLIGIGIALPGTLWASVILDLVVEASYGKLNVDSYLQDRLLTWEISALAMLAGSALAGATTVNGLKQGLCVGVITAIVLVGLRLGGRIVYFDAAAVSLIAALALCLLGGWFGSQLFPPLTPYFGRSRGRRRFGPAQA